MENRREIEAEETVLRAHFVKKLFKAEDTGYMIALCSAKASALPDFVKAQTEGRFSAVGYGIPESETLTCILHGLWKKSDKYGYNFVVNYVETELPTTLDGVTAYFTSLKIGIGVKLASKLHAQFGDSLWEIINMNPAALLAVDRMTQKKLSLLEGKIQDTKIMRELTILLHGEITPRKAEAIIRELGEDCVEKIRRDPFVLCRIKGFGFKTVDRMARQVESDPQSALRVEAAGEFVLENAAAHGHTCYPVNEFLPEMYTLLNAAFPTETVDAERCKSVTRKMVNAKEWRITCGYIYSSFHYRCETMISEELQRIIGVPTNSDTVIDMENFFSTYETQNGISLSQQQKTAVQSCFSSRVNVITGGPGTGKTTIIKAIIALYGAICEHTGEGSLDDILLMAPTGRAARRMTETTGCPASTVHSTIGYRGDSELESTEDISLCAAIAVIDEASMLDAFIAAKLLKMLNSGISIVFVGDEDQLPAVGAGNVLGDLIRSRTIPVHRLDTIYRQAQKSLVVTNAKAICEGKTDLQYGERFQLFEISESEKIMNRAIEIYISCVHADGIDSTILLCPMRSRDKSTVSVERLNALIQEKLNPARQNQMYIRCSRLTFRVKDRVMQTRNTKDVSNGDVGNIKDIVMARTDEDSEEELVALIEFNGDGVLRNYNCAMLTDVDLAYATTVHKAQGSEYETVVLIVTREHTFSLRRNLIYTAITRAKKNCAMVGQAKAVSSAIRNNRSDKRYTLLADRLHKMLPETVQKSEVEAIEKAQ